MSGPGYCFGRSCCRRCSPPSRWRHRSGGETISSRGTIREDVYLAGRSVEVRAQVEDDVLAAGGAVTGRATVDDDVRTAGGSGEIAGHVGDDIIAAGGEVLRARTATVGGRAWLAGGSVAIAGQVGKAVRAAAGDSAITGQIAGDVELAGENIAIGPHTVIRGNLAYYSANEARIDPQALIAGTVTRRDVEARAAAGPSAAGARFGLFAAVAVATIVYYLLLPVFRLQTAAAIRAAPWSSLGLGLALLASTPLVVVLLFISVLGIWLALVVLALYIALLVTGLLTSALALADFGLMLTRRTETPTRAWRIGSIAATFVLLWLLCFFPGLGALAVFTLLVLGTGTLGAALWRRYRTLT